MSDDIKKILIVEDNKRVREDIKRKLPDYEYAELSRFKKLKQQDFSKFDLILLDREIQEKDGRNVWEWFVGRKQQGFALPPIILMSGKSDMERVVQFQQALGARSANKQPEDTFLQRLQTEIEKILAPPEPENMRDRLTAFYDKVYPDSSPDFVGLDEDMKEVCAQLERLAAKDFPVLVTGETGTGKEWVARQLHYKSNRPGKFVPVNLIGLSENLIESELFGHVKGAFTSAVKDRPGLIETAENGTLFLDEIGEVPMSIQAKLLRVLENSEYSRVGCTQIQRAKVRFIFATHKDIYHEVQENRFRADFYYRMGTAKIQLLPLKSRSEKALQLLIEHFIRKEELKENKGIGHCGIADAVYRKLRQYEWPGNVRQLKSTIKYLLTMAEENGQTPMITMEHLPWEIAKKTDDKEISANAKRLICQIAAQEPTELSYRRVEHLQVELGYQLLKKLYNQCDRSWAKMMRRAGEKKESMIRPDKVSGMAKNLYLRFVEEFPEESANDKP